MEFPTYLLYELVPEGEPSERYAVGRVTDLAADMGDSDLRRSYLWANALTMAAMESFNQMPSRLSGLSAGFLYLPPGLKGSSDRIQQRESFAFGIGLQVSTGELGRDEMHLLEVDGRLFPVLITHGPFQPHGGPTHPQGGSGACWVKHNQPNGWSHGILTCRHTMVNMPLGMQLKLHPSRQHSQPRAGYLADIDACTIDASVIGICHSDWPAGLNPLPIHRAVAPGQPVAFQGRHSHRRGTVLRVFQLPSYIGNLFGQRVFTDCFGIPGDSGSLLVDQRKPGGIGIYMGTVPDGSGGSEGLFQHLSQASTYFNFSTYL